MSSFKMYNCDWGFKYNGQTYKFDHVASLNVEDPERNQITRGANASNKVGIAYKDGLTEPKRWTLPILDMTKELKELLDLIFDSQARCEVFAIDRTNGNGKMARNAVLSNRPQQLTIDETPESLQVSLEWVTFDSAETFKA